MQDKADMPDLSALDVSQLRLLHLLLTEPSVSAAAETLGVSQPAVSARLGRLRTLFRDPLLVRAGAALIPTDRGRALIGPLEDALEALEALGRLAVTAFDARSSRRHLAVAAPNYLGADLLPRLAQAVTEAAPEMRLSLETSVPGRDYGESLATGQIDLLVGNWPEVPGHLRSLPLPEDRLVCVVARDHPLASGGRPALQDWLALDHISPSPGTDWRFSPVDGQLHRMRIARPIKLVVPDYTMIPRIVARSRLVLTTGARFARLAAETAPVAVVPAPRELGAVQFRLLWHTRSQTDEAHRWLRGLLRDIAFDPDGPPSLGRPARRRAGDTVR